MSCLRAFEWLRGSAVGLVVAVALVVGAGACASGTPGAVEVCGDGLLVGAEECDDGNTEMGDGCDALCAIEDGYACDDDAEPSVCGPLCGDGLVVGTEVCDGSALNGTTCESLELGGGELACDDTCQMDTSGCLAYTCGNGVLDGSEECDGADAGGETCENLGYDGGTLACTVGCTIDSSACLLFSCGNGVVEGVEGCDDGNVAAGDGCSSNCSVEEGWACVGQPSVCAELCGNQVHDTGEQCDGADLDGQTCDSLGLGYDGGTLACGFDCTFNTAQCELPTCGNAALDAGEQCDGILLNGETCATVGGYIGGAIACLPSCSFDLSGCIPVSCGDGIVSPGEACDDGNQVGGDGCNILCNVESGWNCTGEPSQCTPLCGNSQLDTGEQCDGALLGGETCTGLGYDLGTLACNANCTYNTIGCSTFSCGDGLVTGLEQCDGANLDGQTCQTVGAYVGGTLQCLSSCAFNLAGCIAVQCGDGILSAGEQCDDGNSTNADGCNLACQVESGWTCTGEPSNCTPLCGNSQLDAGEQCDGGLLGGQTCVGLGFDLGTLACAANCTYDITGCSTFSCGDSIVTAPEECDTGNLDGETCVSLGYLSGTLSCHAGCTFNTSSCVAPACGDGIISAGEQCDDSDTTGGDGCNAVCQIESGWSCTGEPSNCTLNCGNSQLDAGEQCDGALLGGQTCVGLGYVGGTLLCNGNCTYNTSSCIAPACGDGIISVGEGCDDGDTSSGDGCNAACQVENGWSCTGEPSNCTELCGNATWDPGEDCDGGDLNGETCQTQGFAGGTLACNGNCTFNTGSCVASICPNGIKEGTEECDTSDFGSQDCSDFGFSTGSLACTGSCTIDTSGCANCPATLTSVFTEDFATPSSSSWTTGSDAVVSTSIWRAYTIPEHGVRIYNGYLEITNDESSWPEHGQGYAYVKTDGASSQYDNGLYDATLASNAGLEIVWSLNMRRNDPDFTDGGFSCSSTSSQNRITVGLAYVLASTSAAGLNASTGTCSASATANGYAVVMGGSSGSVRLVRFTNGLRNGALTNIVQSGGFSPDRYFSVRVTFNADTNLWQLEARSDGSSSFSDPASGSYGFSGTGTDSTYVNTPLEYAGPYFQTGCTGNCSETYVTRFDNLDVGVRCAP